MDNLEWTRNPFEFINRLGKDENYECADVTISQERSVMSATIERRKDVPILLAMSRMNTSDSSKSSVMLDIYDYGLEDRYLKMVVVPLMRGEPKDDKPVTFEGFLLSEPANIYNFLKPIPEERGGGFWGHNIGVFSLVDGMVEKFYLNESTVISHRLSGSVHTYINMSSHLGGLESNVYMGLSSGVENDL